MANSDKAPTLLPPSTSQEQQKESPELNQGSGRAVQHQTQSVPLSASSTGDFAPPSTASADQAKTTSSPTDSQPTPPPARPTLVQLPSASSNSNSTSSPLAPHPKKFSSLNINKKFLEKNSSVTTAAPSSSIPSSAKSGSPIARPQPQTHTTHSRLVTAKLTATPSHSTGTAGWSRPSSVTPSPAATGTSSPSGTSPLPSAANVTTTAPVAPQLSHSGKVIQPQPRTLLGQQPDLSAAKSSGKPVWGNLKPPALSTPVRTDITPNDFPTAAEVANAATSSRKPKSEETKSTTSDAAAAASRQARLEEADTFRGVHLDPNAHHWDEMEEDDDNFLGGVIEFGDGRQYKIEATPEPPPASPPRSISGQNDTREHPVSKEDRFGEDFDRSWPRSRASPASSARDFTSTSAGHPTASPASSTNPLHSPQESSRVLFNERLNRLEPYSHRPPPATYQSKRGSFESSGSNVQLLQKSGGAGEFSRSPVLGRRESGFGSGPFSDRTRSERDTGRRDVPPSPRMAKDSFGHAMGPTTSWGARDRDLDRGRRSDMGPPPLPTHTMRRPSRESGRQLPPHLSQVSPNMPVRRLPSRESSMREPHASSDSIRHPSQSPALSHKSLAAISPIAGGQAILPPLSAPELDEVRKDLMHTAAERAKQRREQEEAEREAQKERARKKAAELEAKMKAAEEAKVKEGDEAAKRRREKDEEESARKQMEESTIKANQVKEHEVLAVIEDAISSVTMSQALGTGLQRQRIPSRSGNSQPEPSRVGVPRRPSGNIPTSASEADSWRAKASPLPPSTPTTLRQAPSRTPSTTLLTPQSAMEQVGTIRNAAANDLEVVDFSDMDKFVSVPEGQTPTESTGATLAIKPARPIASDFFDDKEEAEVPPSATKSDFGTWRRQVVHDVSTSSTIAKDATKEQTSEEKPRALIVSAEATTTVKEHDRRSVTQVITVPPHIGHNQRTPRGQTFYKESTMSALDDAMSRIKGALDASKESHPSVVPVPAVSEATPRVSLPASAKRAPTPPPPPPPPPKDRWLPPAMRQRTHDFQEAPVEVFDVTAVEPPLSPKPAWNTFTVRFPKDSHPREFIGKRQLNAFHRLPLAPRWDILSFEPPVEGMNKRDLSLNDVLFRRPLGGLRGKPRFKVYLPRSRLPSAGVKINGAGAFGKPTVADGAASWRKTSSSADKPQVGAASMDPQTENGLDTTSRSPPPEALHIQPSVASIPRSTDSSLSKADGIAAPVRSRSIPKMPAGSAVAVLRDSRIDVIEADSEPLVNFIVNSELEDGQQQEKGTQEDNGKDALPTIEGVNDDRKRQVNGTMPSSPDPMSKSDATLQTSNNDSKDSTESSMASAHQASPWPRASLSLPVKESGVRAPDPEHLKAVWSQTSDKAGVHVVNSLEGIADDLISVPFTLQDVKSEDGGTPPPAIPTAPSRMSIHDVTRAFQQVPSSSNSTTHRATMSPPTTTAPVARPTTTYPSFAPMRPHYSYSPMMSPAPVMYHHPVAPSPVPSRMSTAMSNGHAPVVTWVPMAGPTPQNPNIPNGMMRPVPSPYPGHMVPYSGMPPMYPQGGMPPPNMPQQMNGMPPGRGRGIPLSPVMTHAGAAMYPGSAPLMPGPAMQNHGYMMPTGRSQTRPDNGQMGSQQHHLSSHSNFNSTPPHNFARSTW